MMLDDFRSLIPSSSQQVASRSRQSPWIRRPGSPLAQLDVLQQRLSQHDDPRRSIPRPAGYAPSRGSRTLLEALPLVGSTLAGNVRQGSILIGRRPRRTKTQNAFKCPPRCCRALPSLLASERDCFARVGLVGICLSGERASRLQLDVCCFCLPVCTW